MLQRRLKEKKKKKGNEKERIKKKGKRKGLQWSDELIELKNSRGHLENR